MLVFTKIATLLIYPLSIGLLFLILALIGQLRGNRAAAVLYTFIALSILYVSSTGLGVALITEPLEARFSAFSPEELPNGDVIVVLGGGIAPEGRYGRWADLNGSVDRIVTAAELWHAKKAERIVVSGGAVVGPTAEADRMAELLFRLGVPHNSIIKESESKNSWENATKVAGVLLPNSSHIMLVTSATHMRRSLALFRAQGFQVTAVPTDHQIPKYSEPVPPWLPTIRSLDLTTRAIHEWVGYWAYDLMGRFDLPDRDDLEILDSI